MRVSSHIKSGTRTEVTCQNLQEPTSREILPPKPRHVGDRLDAESQV
jgi:hypothetical protein